MKIEEHVSLRDYSTMRLGGKARYFTKVISADEMRQAFEWAQERGLLLITIGGGSNIIWRDEGFHGLVILNRITGFSMNEQTGQEALFAFGAGENWDDLVERTVEMGYSGLEFLSWIPGRAGATPVQNVGAYGREISDVLESVDAIDTQTGHDVTIPAADCDFSYRSSRFNRQDKGRFLITSITVRLSKRAPQPPFYASIEEYLSTHNITECTPKILREAVIEVRKKKLPDPDVVANNGSFFANPIVDMLRYELIKAEYPDVVAWPEGTDKMKISAAWLLDRAGFKDYHDPTTGMATWNKQPLVLINENARTTADLEKFKAKLIAGVEEKFGIALRQEPELI